jgi:hypothetical protein
MDGTNVGSPLPEEDGEGVGSSTTVIFIYVGEGVGSAITVTGVVPL